MAKTVKGLIEHCKKAVANNVKYVYGAKMQVLTRAQIQSLQNTYGKSYVWDSDLNKAGHLCCDCSGLISSYTGITRSSSNYNATATASVSLATLKANWSKYVGWGLWMSGHIGVVSDTEGYYYAMDGSARNMVHYPLSKQGWSKAIKLCDIDYSVKETVKEDDEMVETGTISVNGKNIKIDKIVKDGSTFIKLRGLENAGFEVGYDAGSKNLILNNKINELPVVVEGVEHKLPAVNIKGYNYLTVRSFAGLLGLATEYDSKNGKVILK